MRIAALGDLHVREPADGALRDLFTGICDQADVLALCGDLTDHGLPGQAKALADALAVCTIPLVAVLGNHDYENGHQDEIKRILGARGVKVLDGEPCELDGVGFAGVKGFAGGFESRMLQPWGEEAIKRFVYESIEESLRLESALAMLHTERKVAVLHYAPVRGTVEGEPAEVIPFLGSSRLAEPLDNFSVSAAFHGHSHYGSPEARTSKGIPVYNASLPLMRRMRPERPFALVEL